MNCWLETAQRHQSIFTLGASSALNPNLFSCLCQTWVHFPFPSCKASSMSGAHRPFYKFDGHWSKVRRVINEGDFYKVQHCAQESPPGSERELGSSFLVLHEHEGCACQESNVTWGSWQVRWHTGPCWVGTGPEHCSAPLGWRNWIRYRQKSEQAPHWRKGSVVELSQAFALISNWCFTALLVSKKVYRGRNTWKAFVIAEGKGQAAAEPPDGGTWSGASP